MSLYKTMVDHGKTLFRWRGHIPLLFIGPLLLAFKESGQMEAAVGGGVEDIWVLFCFILSLSGIALRALTVGFVPAATSGRNAREQRASVLNTTGLYSIVRNPLYLANFIIILGVLLSIKVLWLVLVVSLAFFIYMERIILTEEDFLESKFGAVYNDWRAKTPAIIPDIKLWRNPEAPFSWKTVLKREYPGLLGMATAFLVTEMVTDLIVEGESFRLWLSEDIAWPVIYGLIFAFCITLRTLKKHTTVLRVEGR